MKEYINIRLTEEFINFICKKPHGREAIESSFIFIFFDGTKALSKCHFGLFYRAKCYIVPINRRDSDNKMSQSGTTLDRK